MERNNDEVIAEILIDLHQLQQINAEQAELNKKFDRRLDLTIRRMVKVEMRLEKIEQRLDGSEKRMESFDKKLELSIQKLDRSIKDQIAFSQMQSKMNQYFLGIINKRMNGK